MKEIDLFMKKSKDKIRIGILTYNKPHLKTQKVVSGLYKKGYTNLKLIINKFQVYKNKKTKVLFNHRPYQFNGLNFKKIAKIYNLKIDYLINKRCFNNIDVVLICGSGIIKKKFIKKNFIINCHSGLIPMRRGLDSLKWAIYNNEKIGNTLHYINHQVDYGKIISHKVTPVLKTDNIKMFAKRHYTHEIEMLINFQEYIDKPKIIKLKKQEPNMRMPIEKEKIMVKRFNTYKKNYVKKYLLK